MRKEVRDYVSTCTIWQSRYIPKAPNDLLQPISSPIAVCEDIFMDFITNLPAYHGQSVIIVVIDGFSKEAHFGTLPFYLDDM